MSTKEELNTFKEELETLNKNLEEVTGGVHAPISRNIKKEKTYMCFVCGELFDSRIYLEDHERFIHHIGFPL